MSVERARFPSYPWDWRPDSTVAAEADPYVRRNPACTCVIPVGLPAT
jgi:hypothetical protein